MKDAQKPDHISLSTLIGRLREGRYVIPDFQREFEWQPSDIRELMSSIFRDYYVGSLLLWKGKSIHFDDLACQSIYGFQGKGEPSHIVLDGQQRLTAMYYAFIAPDEPAPHRSNRFLYFIRVNRFMEQDYDEAFEYDWTKRGLNLIEDPAAQFESHMFPLLVVGKGGFELFRWVQGYEQHWRKRQEEAASAGDETEAAAAAHHVENANAFGELLQGIAEQYQIAYIELDVDLELEKVCDIFTQINSRGVRLDVFDLINALLRPKEIRLKEMWREVAPRFEFVDAERMNVYVLQVMSILCQAYCSPKYLYYMLPGREKTVRDADRSLRREILVPDADDFRRRWDQAVGALSRAVDLLRHPQEFGVSSSQYLPYVAILPAFAALQAAARALPASGQLDTQRKIRHWYWASVFTNRYSGSVESTSARDFLDVKAWFDDDAADPPLIAEFKERFRSLDLRRETRRGSSIYNGIFNLLVIHGARDWITGTVPQLGELDDLHIVPQNWGKENGLAGQIDTILNRTPLIADTNRNVVTDRLPNEYLPELIAKNDEGTVRATLESHFISPVAFDVLLRDPFTEDDFEAFLAERQRTLLAAIEDLLVKERLDLPPRLRVLDAEIEGVELALRRVVDAGLDCDPGSLPPHILQKIDERLQTAARKNPALDQDRYATLAGKLEYADLRELEAAITGKATWENFKDTFPTKEVLAKYVGQLAELRNAIRHSRAVDEVTRMEGEAAIKWFEQVLKS